jgi:hypothetical protein
MDITEELLCLAKHRTIPPFLAIAKPAMPKAPGGPASSNLASAK